MARGEEAGQPAAADMQAVEWNEELAIIAQTWAEQCDCVFQQTEVFTGTFRNGICFSKLHFLVGRCTRVFTSLEGAGTGPC